MPGCRVWSLESPHLGRQSTAPRLRPHYSRVPGVISACGWRRYVCRPHRRLRDRGQPVAHLACHPRPVVQGKIVAGVRMDRQGNMPTIGEPLRASRIDQPVLRCRQQQQVTQRIAGGSAIARRGQHLAQSIAPAHRVLPGILAPGREHLRLRRAAATRQAQDPALLPLRIPRCQHQGQERRVISRPQAPKKRAEGPQAGVDQNPCGHLLRVAGAPRHRHHRPEGKRQHLVGRREALGGQRGAAVFGHVLHPQRAGLVMQAPVAGQVERQHPGIGDEVAEYGGERTPVARLAHQAAQENPGAHGAVSRYQRCRAACRCCDRASAGGTQLRQALAARVRKSSHTRWRRSTRCRRCRGSGLNMPSRENICRGLFFTQRQDPISSVRGRKTRRPSSSAFR